MAIVRNLATVKTTADITSSATSIPVNRVDVFGTSQTTLDNPFYVTIMPASGDEPANSTNSEIVLVTGISGSNLTVTRGQRSTTAKAFNSGAIVTMAIYAEDAVLLGDGGTDVGTPAPWINTSDIKNGAITTDKIADGAVKSAKIDFTKFKFPIPDYSKGTSISNSTNTWIAPKCGVVVALLVADTANGYKNVTISVNDKTVASALWAGAAGGYNFQTRAIIPVATGDVVKFSANDGQSKVDKRVFYPYKWV